MLEEQPHAVAEAIELPRLADHRGPVVEVGPHRVPAGEGRRRAVGRLLLFDLKRAKDAIPDDQDARVVSIEVLGIGPVVHAVVGGRVEHGLERTHAPDQPGVDPKLIEGVELHGDQVELRRDPEQAQGCVEPHAGEALKGALAQGHGEVVVLALVVNDVACPQEVDLVGGAVEPVVGEVDPEQRDRPGHPALAVELGHADHLAAKAEGAEVQGEADPEGQDPAHAADDPAVDVVEGVVEAVDPALEHAGGDELDPDQDEEDRDREGDQADHRAPSLAGSGLGPASSR